MKEYDSLHIEGILWEHITKLYQTSQDIYKVLPKESFLIPK
jgi:hypothetical protein